MDVFEAINPTRAMRLLKPDPVPDELVWKVLDAAIRAPSGGNRQPWNFIVVRDEAAKKKIAEWYLEAWKASYGPMKDAMAANATYTIERFREALSMADVFLIAEVDREVAGLLMLIVPAWTDAAEITD